MKKFGFGDILHDFHDNHILLDVLHDHLVKHLLRPILDVLHESKKPRKVRQKKKKKLGFGSCPPGKCTVWGLVNVRIWG